MPLPGVVPMPVLALVQVQVPSPLPVPALVPVAVLVLMPGPLTVDLPCVADVQCWKDNQTQLSLFIEVIAIQNTTNYPSQQRIHPPPPPPSPPQKKTHFQQTVQASLEHVRHQMTTPLDRWTGHAGMASSRSFSKAEMRGTRKYSSSGCSNLCRKIAYVKSLAAMTM